MAFNQLSPRVSQLVLVLHLILIKIPEVETLFDWGGVAEKELADALRELNVDGDVTDSREDVSTQLREGVVDCAEASGISVFSETTSERSSMPA